MIPSRIDGTALVAVAPTLGPNRGGAVLIVDPAVAAAAADFDGGGGDRVQIAANLNDTGIDTFAELQAAATNDADGNVEIALGSGNTLTLMGFGTAQPQSGWFASI